MSGEVARFQQARETFASAAAPAERLAALTELTEAAAAVTAGLAAAGAQPWLLDQARQRLTATLTTAAREAAHTLEDTVAVDREWVETEIVNAVLNKDISRAAELAEYAKANDDEGLATDINDRIVKPHRTKWGKGA